jgi:hypothetical protein
MDIIKEYKGCGCATCKKLNVDCPDCPDCGKDVAKGDIVESDHCGSVTCADCAHKMYGGACTPGSPDCKDMSCQMCNTKKMMDGTCKMCGGMNKALAPTCDCANCQGACDCGDCVQCGVNNMGKRDFNSKERERMASAGTAMPDGSYPIANRTDLENAIRSWGRGGAKEDVKRHIISRARSLGAEDLIPDNWKSTSKSLWGGSFDPLSK